MKARAINRQIIKLLKSYAYDKEITLQHSKHIKVIGTYNGEKRVITLASSPSRRYKKNMICVLRRFLLSIGVATPLEVSIL